MDDQFFLISQAAKQDQRGKYHPVEGVKHVGPSFHRQARKIEKTTLLSEVLMD